MSWSYDIKMIALNQPPGAANLTLDEKEALWRDPTLAQLGYVPGLTGVNAYIQDLRSRLHTRWAYCAFFTKYPLGWFAYASIGGPRLVMDPANDGWGPDNIDRVFAHETGHIFGAPDEYSSSACNCDGQWGFLKAPNGNCQNCATGSGVACIMRSNDWAMCDYTKVHYGWRDTDNHGILDPDDRAKRVPPWVVLWLCRRYPELCRFLSALPPDEQEDLVPMSLLARLLNREDVDAVEAAGAEEQVAYLTAIVQSLEQASSELKAIRRSG